MVTGKIEGVIITPLKRISTPKGDVLHAMKASDNGYAGFGEVYFSEVNYADIKGWKCHTRMTLNIVVVSGTIRFTMYDGRENSPTCGRYMRVELTPDNVDDYARLTIPPCVWMAFEGISPGKSILMDVIPELHDPNEAVKCDLSEINY